MLRRVVRTRQGIFHPALTTFASQSITPISCVNVVNPLVDSKSNFHRRSNVDVGIRNFHSSVARESTLIVGGLAVAVAAKSLQYAIQAYNQRNTNNSQATATASGDEPLSSSSTSTSSTSSSSASSATPGAGSKANSRADTKKTSTAGAGETSIFTSWFARNFYDGGFEEKMTRREAALILGIRESATSERIKDAHRKVLILNHPDRGGSAYIAAKINEAKDLLLKSKSS